MVGRVVGILLALALALTACSGGDFDAFDPGPGADGPTGGDDGADPTGPGPGPGGDDAAMAAAADEWIRTESGLGDDVIASISTVGVEHVGNASHVRYVQVFDGVPVDGAGLIVHLLSSGEVQGASSTLTDAVPLADDMIITRDEAADVGAKAVQGTVTDASVDQIWIAAGGDLYAGWRVDLATTEPLGSWSVIVEGVSSTVVRVERDELGRVPVPAIVTSRATGRVAKSILQVDVDRCPLPAAPSACVFQPDPIFAAGGTLEDPADANSFLSGVPLEGLLDEASGRLVGEYADLEPELSDSIAPPQPDGTWGLGRGDRGFEAQNTYFWIDYGQRELQRLGFTNLLDRPFPVVSVHPETVDNAFYSPFDQAIFLGIGSNGINEGEDASGILHEYGHALLDAVNRDLLSGGGDVGAYHEGFGDIYAYFTTLEFRTGDAECFFAWTDGRCLRRMDGDKIYPDDVVREVHDDGEIITGAIFEVFTTLLANEGIDVDQCPGTDLCNEVRDRMLTTVLAANYYITAGMSLPDIAGAFLDANDAQYESADDAEISAVFASRGLGGGDMVDDGEPLVGTTAEGVGVQIDIVHTYRGDLNVEIHVLDADFQEVCPTIPIYRPDPDDDAEDLSGFIDLGDDPCAAFLPPSPDRQWVLFAEDTVANDEGSVLNFTVFDGVDPHPAPGLPLAIADADPTGSVVIIDGTGAVTTMDDAQDVGQTDAVYFADIALTHTYQGDLSLRAGVADEEGTITCSVTVAEADPADSTSGTIDGQVDLTECAALWPPAIDRQWFVQVIDHAAQDTGTIDRFAVVGEGERFDFTDVPVDIPDDDVDGVALVLDGSGSSNGQVGGGGQQSDIGLPAVSVEITHPYAGDLSVIGGVIDAGGEVLCEAVLVAPDQTNTAVDLAVEASMASCGSFYPPSADRQWVLLVADTLSGDTGVLERATLVGPDGVRFPFTDQPVALPDADPDGVFLAVDGMSSDGTRSGDPEVVVIIGHPYVGDLRVVVGVVDAAGEVRCSAEILTPDANNAQVDATLDVAVPECAGELPPSPDRRWVVVVADEAEFDRGRIEAFGVFAPDGGAWGAGDSVPVRIPDDDTDGAAAFVDGSDPLN